jgi:hypothetical protein
LQRQAQGPSGYAYQVKFEYAYSSSARWVDTTGANQTLGDKNAVFRHASENGWELICVAEGTLYFKRPMQSSDKSE